MITSFNFPSQENAGGIKLLEFIPTYNIARFPKVVNNKAIAAIALALGTDWLTGYYTQGTGEASSPEDLTAAGVQHANGFGGVMPKVGGTVHELFSEMEQTPFVLKYTDRNNVKMIMGSVESPMFFRFRQVQQTRIKERNGYSFQFYNIQKNTGVIYPF